MTDGEKPKDEAGTPTVYGTEDGAREIGIAPVTLRKLAARGLAKGKKRGVSEHGDWQFTPEEIARLKVAYGPPVASCA